MLEGFLKLMKDPTLLTGQKLDVVIRELRLKQWSRVSVIRVRAFGQDLEIFVRKGTTDHIVVWQCFAEGQFNVPTIRNVAPAHALAVESYYRRTVQSGKIPLILDVGANIGASTAWFMSRYPDSSVTAVEPAPGNFALLNKNAADYRHIELLQAGVGPIEGQSYLHDGGGGDWGYRTLDNATGLPTKMVTVGTLLSARDQSKFQPFILKLDIEGAERELFSGSWTDIAKFPIMIIELHDFCMTGQQTSNSFFRFHAEMGREFLFGHENVFSLDMRRLTEA